MKKQDFGVDRVIAQLMPRFPMIGFQRKGALYFLSFAFMALLEIVWALLFHDFSILFSPFSESPLVGQHAGLDLLADSWKLKARLALILVISV